MATIPTPTPTPTGTTIFGVSKTTIAGVLSALIGVSGPLSAFLAALQAIKGGATPDYTLAITGAIATFVFAVLRIWVGLLQGDAPAQG